VRAPRSPVYTFLPYTLNSQPHLIAGYLCTPLVKFPIASLEPGDKVRGTTIAELGAGNRPLDMDHRSPRKQRPRSFQRRDRRDRRETREAGGSRFARDG
jgi:hypothetical protein